MRGFLFREIQDVGSFGFQRGWRCQAAGARIRLKSGGSQGGFAIRPAFTP